MRAAYFSHPEFLLHDMGAGHPEQPARLRAVEDALRAEGLLDRMQREIAPEATEGDLLLAHGSEYLTSIRQLAAKAASSAPVPIDADTFMNEHTLSAALHAAGALVRATDLVLEGQVSVAFCAVRPPGHHAERDRAMGFCFFNNVAIAALHAIRNRGLSRVAILDFDVHHGNGTEDIVRGEPGILLCSSFQHPLYPGTAFERDPDRMVNVPLRAGTDSQAYRAALQAQWFPRLEAFAPELILISAGFDAHQDDPLAQLELTEADYEWVTREAVRIAGISAGGRIVSALEGGYDLDALGKCAAAHVRALIEGAISTSRNAS